MRPAQRSRVLAGCKHLRETIESSLRIALHQFDARQHVQCFARYRFGLQFLFGKLLCTKFVALLQFEFSLVHGCQHRTRSTGPVDPHATHQFRTVRAEKWNFLCLIHLVWHIHAIDHLTDALLQADAFAIHQRQLVIERLGEYPA